MIDKNFWQGKKVLLSGHTGFVGSWMTMVLCELGAEVIGYSTGHYTELSNFQKCDLKKEICHNLGDIRDREHLQKVFTEYQPEIVVHLAAQPLIGRGLKSPYETYEINLIGTMNLLECIYNSSVRAAIFVSSERRKDEEKDEELMPFTGDPYRGSKMCAEIMVNTYRESFMHPSCYNDHKKAIAIVRNSNMIGGGDWSVERLVPDCIRAIEKDQAIEIKAPRARRSWLYVLDAVLANIILIQKLYTDPVGYSKTWNVSAGSKTESSIRELVEKVISSYGKGSYHISNPCKSDNTRRDVYADHLEGWIPALDVSEIVERTVWWYKNYQSESLPEDCRQQVREYLNKYI